MEEKILNTKQTSRVSVVFIFAEAETGARLPATWRESVARV